MNRFISLLLTAVFLFTACGEQTKPEQEQQIRFCLNGKVECLVSSDKYSVRLLTNVEQVSPETLFSVALEIENVAQLTKVSGYLEGVSMYMGKIPLVFNIGNSDKQFIANGFVGSCSEPQMYWRIIVDFEFIDASGQQHKAQVVDNFYSRSQ
ncbi:hypothetical protein LP316_12100 [Thalassotalea sp. LPB0316]|uniref:hypothetical protein n=1 Tax=Thalassotalea sp. LPB0316 TaxID=2769490 RepID=UPI001865E75B|nr:hypothetical protein [Thalassotalea sp. LPB0316]QOL25040.1 hypothetical protein LP316_12100 [Thalassotalea sp. LPB0316]